MKSLTFLFLFLLIFSLSTYAEEGAIGLTVIDPPSPFTKNLSVYGGIGLSNFDYKEQVELPHKSMEKGLLTTFILGATKVFDHEEEDPNIYKLEARFSPSSTTYDGSTMGGEPLPLMKSENSYFIDLEGTVIFQSTPQWNIYAGLGYHGWERGKSGNFEGAYSEYYRWLNLPLGVIYKTTLNKTYSLQIDAGIRPTLMGKMTAYMSSLIGKDFGVNLGPTIGTKLQVTLQSKISENQSLNFAPWIESNSIGESDKFELGTDSDGRTHYFYEPASRTIQYGMNVAYNYSF